MASIFCPTIESLSKSDEVLLESVLESYNLDPIYITKFLNIVKRKNGMSLRVIDWLVTNYSKVHSITIGIDGIPRDLNRDYQKNLNAYNKKNLDPFARRNKIILVIKHPDGSEERRSSTVGQLNFFRWFCKNNLDVYLNREKRNIDEHMRSSESRRRKNKTEKVSHRPKISSSKSYVGTFEMNFDF